MLFRILAVACGSFALLASEVRVQMKDLPEAVRKTVQEQTQNATLRGLAKEIEHGKTYYEAETLANGKSRDILMDVNGAIVEIEEAVAFESLSPEIRKGLQARAGSGKIKSVESVTKGAAVVSYEAVVLKNGVKSEVAVNADGTAKTN